ncbi:MAG: hypothetical protein PHE02_11325 [Lachnospiraceae bacterium]|nr:hypothetical protein [Lachnospiraceae bacterium]
MKLPFFASFIVFTIWLTYEIKKNSISHQKNHDAFWDKENAANSTRRKSLEHLDYITLPMDKFPMDVMAEDETVRDIQKTILILNDKKIVNFTGFTNTQLKLEYGAPNITLLTEYDQNFTMLVRTLQKWAALLIDNNHINEGKMLLEYAVSIRSDVSKSYKMLADIYSSEGNLDKIRNLVTIASTLNSAMKNAIVHTLQESYLCNDSPHFSSDAPPGSPQ